MASSVARQDVRTEANSLRTRLDDIRGKDAMLRSGANSAAESANYGTYRAVIREAMRRSGLSQKAFAIDAKQSESVISEALGGTRALACEWVWAQTSEAFQASRIDVEREARGMDEAAIAAAEDRQLTELFIGLMRRRTA